MFINSTKLLLSNTMMIGVIMTICSNNWISMWMGLEITLMSFIPLMQTNKSMSAESMIKYFIIQSVASTLMLMMVLIMLIGVSMMNEMLLMISMLIKVGSAPFHNWVLMIIETLSYNQMWTMLTIIKIPPLLILYQININFLMMPIVIGMIISSLSCLNQTSLRKTLGYSSIYNISLMLITINKFYILMIFMSIYSIMLIMFVKITNSMKISFINQLIFNEKMTFTKINLWINMLSMGGFPPMMGFINKLLVIQLLFVNKNIMLVMLIILTSMLVMLFYMRLAFTSMMTNTMSMKWSKNSKSYLFVMIFNLASFPVLISMTSIT
uniref:NADH-ubiquinone oxidoreductase chain 2 n=1 Tax=Drabescus ineffectus TaxID=2754845 RepID=A0A7G3XWD9_9HEMI|nr:NADH dehydrogenase subunit 2 [Drabescus ineffectus]QLJ57893.1 NADH dehydrogenase subunit 2 [Drabescus ineffectus]